MSSSADVSKGLKSCFSDLLKSLKSSTQTRNWPVLEMAFPFPVMAPISSTVLLRIPLLLETFHLVRSTNWQSAITGTGCDSFVSFPVQGVPFPVLVYAPFPARSFTGPAPELDSMRVVPFPVPGSASSGTVIYRVPYWNWHLCVVPFTVPGSASSGMVIFWVPY